MSEPIFSALSGKFSNRFTVSGFTGPRAVFNGEYTAVINNQSRGSCSQDCWLNSNCGPNEANDCQSAESDTFQGVNDYSTYGHKFEWSNGNWWFFGAYWIPPNDPQSGPPDQILTAIPNETSPPINPPGYENFLTDNWVIEGDTLTITPL